MHSFKLLNTINYFLLSTCLLNKPKNQKTNYFTSTSYRSRLAELSLNKILVLHLETLLNGLVTMFINISYNFITFIISILL